MAKGFSPATSSHLACDLGAESGRVMLGILDGGHVELRELHRFPSAAVRVGGTLRWDVLRIFEELKAGLRAAAREGAAPVSVSTDSWGVDYVWIREGEPSVGVPFHYRDGRNADAFERVFAKVPAEEVFERTGIQFMPFNTLFQLDADARQRPWVFEVAERFLNIADYFNWLLSGVAASELTLASTTQLLDARARAWSLPLAQAIGLPERLLPPVVQPATRLGPLRGEIAEEAGLSGLEVVASCSHDTGAAVAAVPAEGDGWAYLSSGTWSLLGVELREPLINEASRRLNFTNEAGFGGTIRFLKNISGLWLVQECRRAWEAARQSYTYGELTALAAQAPALRSLVHPNAPRFATPGGMPEKIAAYCRETGQPEPSNPGEFTRCALESLALLYRQTLREIAECTGWAPRVLHIVGGGSRNDLLNQMAADATGLPVLAGPEEATALGSVLAQACAMGRLGSLEEIRAVVRASLSPRRFEPRETAAWEAASERFRCLPAE